MKTNKKEIIFILLIIALVNIILNYNFFVSKISNKNEKVYYLSNTNTNTYEIKNITDKFDVLSITFDIIPIDLTIEYQSADLTDYKHFNSPYSIDKISDDKLFVYKVLGSDITSLRITTTGGQINKIILNPKVKYNPYIYRTIIISFTVLLIICLSKYKEKLDLKNRYQNILTIIVIGMLILVTYSFAIKHYPRENNLLYIKYADAIINKKLELDYPVIESENPYDPSTRYYNYLWDASLYKGKYYCYFGILPIVTIFIPIKLLTGNYLSMTFVSYLYSILAIIFSYTLYRNIIKKYFPKIEYRIFIISFAYIMLGSKLLWCMHRCDYYELISIAAYAHIILGLNLVLFNEKNSVKRDLFGYLLLALSVLCRPTSLFLSVLVIPKIIEKYKKHEFKLKNILSLILPYIIIGIIVMYMNYIRFDNIFEFGVTYQLTTTNYIHNHFSILRAFIGFVHYFFEPFQIRLFPFYIKGIDLNYPIISDFSIGETGGGIIFTSIIGIIIFYFPKLIKYIKDKKLRIYLIVSLIIAMLLLVISSGSVGIVGRYMFDFNYIFYFIIVVLFLTLLERDKSITIQNIFYKGMILSIIINYCLALTNII